MAACSIQSNIQKGLTDAPSSVPQVTGLPVTLSSAASNPHNSSVFSITIDFADQAVTGLMDADFTVTNGTASNLVGPSTNGQGGSTFTMDITPAGAGNFVTSIRLPADSVTNGAAEGNALSNLLTLNIDDTPPSIAVTGPVTVVSNYIYTVTYSGASTINLTNSDITLGGTATTDCVANVTNGTSSVATVTVSGCTGAGTVNISILADTAEDSVGNKAPAYGPSNDATVVRIPFAVTLSSLAASPHNASAISVTVDFGTEVVAGSADLLQLADFTVTNGSVSNLVDTGSGTEFTVDVTPTGTGTTTIKLPKETVLNGTGNTNADSNTLSFTIDADAPTINVTGPVTSGSDYVYTVTYTGATTYLLTNGFIVFGGTAAVGCSANVTNGGTSVATVTVSGCSGVGTMNISILANSAKDAVDNFAPAYGPSSNANVTQPPFAVTLSSAASNPHNASAISVTIDFGNEVVAGSADLLQLADFTVTNGSVSNLVDLGAGKIFTVDLTPTGTGTTTIKLPQETVRNISTTQNADSNTLSFTIDADAPTLAFVGPNQATSDIVYTVNYTGATSVNLLAANITVGGTDTTGCGTPVVTNGTTTSATVTISGCNGDGTVNISVAANTAQDAVGNQAAAYGPSANATVSNAYIMTIDTRNVSAASPDDKTVGLALEDWWGYDFKVNWGDGASESYVNGGGSGRVLSHTYATAGVYDVKIYDATDFAYFRFCYANNTTGDQLKLVDVKHWGSNQFYRMSFMFARCKNVQISATDAPDLSRIITDGGGVNGLRGMFQYAETFNSNINHWDVSAIKDMSNMFAGAKAFNQPLSTWSVSNVTDMTSMFSDAEAFNQDISSWDTSSVTSMARMFMDTNAFNQPLARSGTGAGSRWDTNNVADMDSMFQNAYVFNQDISNWRLGSLTTMNQMFFHAELFNQDLHTWSIPTATPRTNYDLGADAWTNPAWRPTFVP